MKILCRQNDKFSAVRTQDSMTKIIYSRLFKFLIDTINENIEYPMCEQYIGILDIAGFGMFFYALSSDFIFSFFKQ